MSVKTAKTYHTGRGIRSGGYYESGNAGKNKKVFYETGEKLAVTDPEFVELIANFLRAK